MLETQHEKLRTRRRTITGTVIESNREEGTEPHFDIIIHSERDKSYRKNEETEVEDDEYKGMIKENRKFSQEFLKPLKDNDNACGGNLQDSYHAINYEQYFADNDQMLGSESLLFYKPNMMLQNTEEEDILELEELILKLNRIFKSELDDTKIDDYTEILCRYFKANIQYSLASEQELSESNLPIHSLITTGLTQNIQNAKSPRSDHKNSKLQKSLSFNFITDFNLKKFVTSILSATQRSSKAEITNSHIINRMEEGSLRKDNIKEIINENLEADELLKIILIGDKASRNSFIMGLRNQATKADKNEKIETEAETTGT